MNNLLLNFLQGNKILETLDAEIYLNSLSKLTTFKKIVFVYNVMPEQIERLKKYYDYIVEAKTGLVPINFCYLAYYDWLCENGKDFDYVMHCDMRDVILQKDPFEFMASHPDKELFLVCEGMQIRENDCNQMWHDWVLNTVVYNKEKYDDSYVLNGGTYGGKTNAFLNYCTLILTAMNRRYNYIIPDQAMLGYLYRQLKQNPNVMLTHPMTDNFCATGEAIKRDNVTVTFDGKNVCTANKESFYLFHQWDRTIYAETLRNKQVNTLSFSI
jgi:hypothetical protein